MKKAGILAMTLSFLLSGCAPHFHLDFLGKEKIEEVVLIKSKAREKILVIDVGGIISTVSNPSMFRREGDILSRVYFRLEKASEDKSVKAVILRLDTPGGEAATTDILYNEILKFKDKTGIPVIALMMGVAASGGYYAAMACDHIIAHPSTITGSIGVIATLPNIEELITKIGVKMNVIKSGKMKDIGSPFRDLTGEEKDVIQDFIDYFYQKFLEVVYSNRKEFLSLEEINKIADGRVYTAKQALDLKLIDEIGYFDSALKTALSLASLKEANVTAYTYYPKQKTNIYASSLKTQSLFENKSMSYEHLFPYLKSGFYYLWVPELTN